MKTVVLVLDGLGIGELEDVKESRPMDEGSNTLLHIHNKNSLMNTIYDKVGLLTKKVDKKGMIFGVPFITKKCILPYEGADSTLGHYAISGVIYRTRKIFIEDIYEEIINWFNDKYTVNYKNGVISLDNTIFISNNVECDPGLNINVLGVLESVSYNEIMEIGKVIREKLPVCRVIVMGGRGLNLEKVYESVDEKERENKKRFKGINIPKANIYDENYQVTHLAYSDNRQKNMLSNLSKNNIPISLLGKTANLFPGYNAVYEEAILAKEVMEKLIHRFDRQKDGLIFANIQELDLAGHSEDTRRAYDVLKTVDKYIYYILKKMDKDDILIITGDHGNDPEIGHSFHTREYVPLIIFGDICFNTLIYSKPSLCDIGNFISNLYTHTNTDFGTNLIIYREDLERAM